MNGHLGQLLDAYLDGELGNGQKRRAEAHLGACAECRAELIRRRALSRMLQAAPAPAGGKSEQRFVAEIALRLQRKAAAVRPALRPAAVAWAAVPVGLFLAWAFVQSAAIVVDALEAIPGVENVLRNDLAASVPQIAVPDAVGDLFRTFAVQGFVSWDNVVLTLALIGIGLLFTGWFAGWWVSQRAAGSHR
jgi:anti-sigma factor RsiW